MVFEHVHKPNRNDQDFFLSFSWFFSLLDMVELNRNNWLNTRAYKSNKVKIEVPMNIPLQSML